MKELDLLYQLFDWLSEKTEKIHFEYLDSGVSISVDGKGVVSKRSF